MDVRIAPETLVPRLGELLIERGLLGAEDLEIALDFQHQKIMSGVPCLIGQALIKLGFVDQQSIDEIVTIQIFQLQNNLEQTNLQLEQRVAERTDDLQEALAKLTELNQLKSNFISNISHELRTPLTHIKGYLDLLADHSLGPVTQLQEDAIAVLQRSEERLEQLIDDLIQFSLTIKGELNLSIQTLDIRQIVEACVPEYQRRAELKDIHLEITIPDNLPKIPADKEKLSWVINQLLDNAIKFTPADGQISLSAEYRSGYVELSVQDTGIGIPDDQIGEIFEPFHQLDGSVTRRYAGTGLGLALVSQIIKAHGSTINVTSSSDAGTRFNFALAVAGSNNDG